jgi:PHD/YefM family antitoxin component YafN of YafNO toxin-antitoxin module
LEPTQPTEESTGLIENAVRLLQQMSQASAGQTDEQIQNWYREQLVASSQNVSQLQKDLESLKFWIQATNNNVQHWALMNPEEFEDRQKEVHEARANLVRALALQRICNRLFDTKAKIAGIEPDLSR